MRVVAAADACEPGGGAGASDSLDVACRLATEEYTDRDGPIRATSYTYDEQGRLVRADSVDHRALRNGERAILYAWDDHGRPLSEEETGRYASLTTWTWTDAGELAEYTFDHGNNGSIECKERHLWDDDGHEVRLEQRGPDCWPGWDVVYTWVDGLLVDEQMIEPGGDRLLFDETYEYDARGRLVHREETGTPGLEWWDGERVRV